MEKLPALEADLRRVRQELEKAKEESAAEALKKDGEVKRLKEEQVALKNKIASRAVAGFQRCLDTVVLLDPKIRVDLLQLSHKVVDGRIVKGDQIIYESTPASSPGAAEIGEPIAPGNDTPAAEDNATPAAEVEDQAAAGVEEAKTLESLD